MALHLHAVVVEGCPTTPYIGTSPRPAVGGYDSFSFTRRTAEQIAADLNRTECGLTASWDGDSLIFTASEEYNGDAFTETVTPDEYGHYAIDALWPWDVWSEDLDPDEQSRAFVRGAQTPHEPADLAYSDTARSAWQRGRREAERLLNPALRGQNRPHRHLVTPEPKPMEAPSTSSHSSPARRRR
ncbi:hypothetical protein ACFWNE_23210 [Streptomyces goshikiensis]|uniref:hypothetical protein n=1 Tax=Streptomyces goshikiensis TaxID=1942 RepID=UPI00365CEE63